MHCLMKDVKAKLDPGLRVKITIIVQTNMRGGTRGDDESASSQSILREKLKVSSGSLSTISRVFSITY